MVQALGIVAAFAAALTVPQTSTGSGTCPPIALNALDPETGEYVYQVLVEGDPLESKIIINIERISKGKIDYGLTFFNERRGASFPMPHSAISGVFLLPAPMLSANGGHRRTFDREGLAQLDRPLRSGDRVEIEARDIMTQAGREFTYEGRFQVSHLGCRTMFRNGEAVRSRLIEILGYEAPRVENGVLAVSAKRELFDFPEDLDWFAASSDDEDAMLLQSYTMAP